MSASLFLIPTTLGDTAHDRVFPAYNREVILSIRHFIVENVRTARRFLKREEPSLVIDELTFYELNKHTSPDQVAGYLAPLAKGESIGVISEAGCPAVADPGADVVAIAQRLQLRVIPLVGPSSIIMSLMGSGFNGQSFAFCGYLPIDAAERARKFKDMEQAIRRLDQTQIFIETPYRNNRLIAEMVKTLPKQMRLCVASDITGPGEKILTRTIEQWGRMKYDYDKIPTIFLLYK